MEVYLVFVSRVVSHSRPFEFDEESAVYLSGVYASEEEAVEEAERLSARERHVRHREVHVVRAEVGQRCGERVWWWRSSYYE